MPYARTSELPPAVRRLPPHAQEIFLSAFNGAWGSYADRNPQAQEEIAFRVAWAAVKKRYRKEGGRWVPQ
ncbi:MAG TPA: ChaB family protein [Stellaceae bacterium]|nr:ChaB family protein [Stellaceae bacterium]